MTSVLVLLPLLLFISPVFAVDLSSEPIYQELVNRWAFAYRIASDIEITSTPVNLTLDTLKIVTSFNLNETTTSFISPVIAFPIAIAYNFPVANATLRLTNNMVRRILTENPLPWNDPELVELNPFLQNIGMPTRVILDSTNSPINDQLIEYFFPLNATQQQGRWAGLVASRHPQTVGFESVTSALGVLTNSMAFVPYPILKNANNPNIKLALLISDDDTVLSALQPITTELQVDGSFMEASVKQNENTWPFHFYGYIALEQETTIETCQNTLLNLRFLYWSFANEDLRNETIQLGFNYLDDESYEQMRQHLLTARCNDQIILTYSNLSTTTRSNVVYGISIGLMTIYLAVMIASWVTSENKRNQMTIINNTMNIIGWCFTVIGFHLWWLSPTSDAYCISRHWFLNFGYIALVSSIFGYTFMINIMESKISIAQITRYNAKRTLLLSYLTLAFIQISILLLWQFVENPVHLEEVVSEIEWTTRNTCSEDFFIVDIVQNVYYCCISVFGCYVLYRYWTKKTIKEPYWLLMAFFMQLLTFIQLIVNIQQLDLTDDSLYVIIITSFIIAEGGLILSWLLPQFFFKVKNIITTSSKSDKIAMDSKNSKEVDI